MKLSTRVNLLIAGIMLVMSGMGVLFAIHTSRQSVAREVSSSLQLAIRTVEAAHHDSSIASMDSGMARHLLQTLLSTRHITVNMDITDGHSITAGSPPLPSVPEWFYWWVSPAPVQKAIPIIIDSRPQQIVLQSNPNDEIVEAWEESKGLLFLIVMQSILVGTLIHILLGRALKNLPQIMSGISKIEQGSYQSRLPEFQNSELAEISEAFNQTMQVLEKTRDETRRLTHHSINLQEEERQALSRELHDELGQSITGIKLLASASAKRREDSVDNMQQIMAVCDHLFTVVRSMMRRLRPTVLDELGFLASLEDMLAQWRQHNPQTSIQLHAAPELTDYRGQASIHLFRIVQEAVSNSLRHGRPRNLWISLQHQPFANGSNWLQLIIEDDGPGFDVEATSPGFGLNGMRERTESLGGQIRVEAAPGNGTRIRVRLPVATNTAAS